MRLYVSEAQCVCMCVYVSETCFFITSTGVLDTRKYSQLFLSVWRFEHRSLCLQKQRLVPPWLHIGFGEEKDFLTVTWGSSGWSTNLWEPPASAFPILGLKVYSTMLTFYMGLRDRTRVLTLTQALNQLSCLPA